LGDDAEVVKSRKNDAKLKSEAAIAI